MPSASWQWAGALTSAGATGADSICDGATASGREEPTEDRP
jgi:hypothetical protein